MSKLTLTALPATTQLLQLTLTAGVLNGALVLSAVAGQDASAPPDPTPTVPGQVVLTSLVAGDAALSATWLEPASSSPILAYTVKYRPTGSVTYTTYGTTAKRNLTLTGLANGQSYDVIVAATNRAGQGTFSAALSAAPEGEMTGDADSFTLTQAGWVSVLVREKATKRVVRSLISKQWFKAGTHPLYFDQLDDDRVPVTGAPTDYEYDYISHRQDFSVPATYTGAIGNTSTGGPTGPHSLGGISLYDAWAEVGADWSAWNGYAETSRGAFRGKTSDPNYVTTLPGEDTSTMSGTHAAKDLVRKITFRGGLAVFGGDIYTGNGDEHIGYAGRAVTAIHSDTGLPVDFGVHGTILKTHGNIYDCLDLKQGGKFITGLAASAQYLFVCHAEDSTIAVFDLDTYALVRTITTINEPGQCCANGNTLVLLHDEKVMEIYTINADGSLTSRNIVLPLAYPGCVTINKQGTLIAANSVAELAATFYGAYGEAQNEVAIVGRIYMRGRRTFRYVGPADVAYTAANWDAIPDAGNALWQYMAGPMPSTASHKVHFFNLDGTPNGEPIGEGDYGTDSRPKRGKFCFADTKYFRDWGQNCFLDFRDDGGLVVSNRGCFAVEFFGPDRQPTQFLQYPAGSYSVAVNATDPRKVYVDYCEWTRNFALGPNDPGGTVFSGNYACSFRPNLNNVFQRLYGISTWSNGRTYALEQDLATYKWYLVELTVAGIVAYPDITTNDLAGRLTKNGDLLDISSTYQVGAKQEFIYRKRTGVDSNGKPTYAAPVVNWKIDEVRATDPFIQGIMADPSATDGLLVGYDIGVPPIAGGTGATRSGDNCWHLCVIDASGKLRWRGMPSTRFNYVGEVPEDGFDIGNNVQRGGTFASVVGNLIAVVYSGEFNKNGQCQFIYWYTMGGHYLGRLGRNRDGAFTYPVHQAGQGGNGITGLAWQVDNVVGFTLGNEGGYGPNGPNEFQMKDLLNTLVYHAPIPVTQFRARPVVGTELFAGLPYNANVASGTGGVMLDAGVLALTSLETLQRTNPGVNFVFNAAGAATVPLSDGLTDLPAWSFSGEMGWVALAGDGRYYQFVVEVLDNVGKVILRLERTAGVDSYFGATALRANSTVGFGAAETESGTIIDRRLTTEQVFDTYYLRPFKFTSDGTQQTVGYDAYAPVTVGACEAGANPKRPTTLRTRFVDYGSGARPALSLNRLNIKALPG